MIHFLRLAQDDMKHYYSTNTLHGQLMGFRLSSSCHFLCMWFILSWFITSCLEPGQWLPVIPCYTSPCNKLVGQVGYCLTVVYMIKLSFICPESMKTHGQQTPSWARTGTNKLDNIMLVPCNTIESHLYNLCS